MTTRTRTSVKVTAVILVVVLLGLCAELSARAVYAFKHELKSLGLEMELIPAGSLDAYEVAAADIPGHWRLRPGYRATHEEFIAQKEEAGKIVGAEAARTAIRDWQSTRAEFAVNADGFRGPEIDDEKKRVRILAIGDSTTFGVGAFSYPAYLQTELLALGIDAEVINAGVEGYTPWNALMELPRYASVKPDVAIVYLGWNALFSENNPTGSFLYSLASVQLIRTLYREFQIYRLGAQEYAMSEMEKNRVADMNDPDLARLETYIPESMSDYTKLVGALKGIAEKVIVLTLPGLLQFDKLPNSKTIAVAQVPEFTNNVMVLAKMTERYNGFIREIARSENVLLVDTAQWSKDALQPRIKYFWDAVHMHPWGMQKMANFVGSEIAPVVRDVEGTR